MIDKTYIVGGGVLLFVIILIAGKSGGQKNSNAMDSVAQVQSDMLATVPSILDAGVQTRQLELTKQSNDLQTVAGLVAKLDSNSISKQEINTGIAAHVVDLPFQERGDIRMRSNEKFKFKKDFEIQNKALENERIRDRNNYKIARKQVGGGNIFDFAKGFISNEQGFAHNIGSQIVGAGLSQSNPAQMVAPATQFLSGMGGGMMGGKGGDSSGGFMESIGKFIPMIMAML